ncbi:MAG: CoB--CoM heterodisulfide reductase iron-sulfur subunit A family protein [bacterium]|nr:CoB--CoM heterodisulfide reductase iron-sulfur subunit A family protein [bacterium]
MNKRIGVFICHCGLNIAGTVDVDALREAVGKIRNVVYVKNYIFLCSQPGQEMVSDAVKEHKLDGFIVANCSPTLHEKTFRTIAIKLGMNPYLVEVANIREQSSWPHSKQPDYATKKALKIIKGTIKKLERNIELYTQRVGLTKRALVIGGGIAGIQAALDIADGGYEVLLLDRKQSIGGHMAQISETFPTLDCPQCIMTPKMTEVAQHPNIKLYTYSEVEEISGFIGNFTVKLRQKARYVDWDKCTGCGECIAKCPSKPLSEFNRNLCKGTAIYRDFEQAVPSYPVINKEACLYFQKGVCRVCEKVCPAAAINYEDKDIIKEEKIGAIIIATGYDLMPIQALGEYGAGKYKDVVDGMQFERLLASTGPYAGNVKRPSDQKVPESVVFIQCAGSRDPETHYPYCSKICCMYTAKQALLYKHNVHHGKAYIFYIDIRSNGKGYEEFVQRVQEEEGVVYIRGKVSKVFKRGDKLVVWGADTLTGQTVEIETDLVVLASAMIPSTGSLNLASKTRLATDKFGWFSEAHPKLRPVESVTGGYFLAGTAQAPRDIPETVAQASGAASKVLALFSNEYIESDPVIAQVDPEICNRCGYCESVCAYGAVKLNPKTRIAEVNEVLCEGCGACAATCPSGAISHRNNSRKQIFDMISVATENYDQITTKFDK